MRTESLTVYDVLPYL